MARQAARGRVGVDTRQRDLGQSTNLAYESGLFVSLGVLDDRLELSDLDADNLTLREHRGGVGDACFPP